MTQDLRGASERKLNFFQTLKAIMWGALGIRKGSGYSQDAAKLNPVHVIVAGLIAVIVFVALLVLAGSWAASSLT